MFPPLIVLLCVTVFVSMLAIGSFPALLPDIGESHGLVDWQLGWRTAIYRIAVDGGMFSGPFVSGLLAGTAPGLLPAVLVGVLLTLGILLSSIRPHRR